ncbi:MarR family winged helix-turn-helix transcriptional regulator [Luteimicrobium sp. NPDC057192]|uniref:MarR family winged helix-turn-helix transcriptional regulator n=1 Tax=Luteimicrobium sp. NPDC057192 TaxID=3346042 RepID=UPI0036373B41
MTASRQAVPTRYQRTGQLTPGTRVASALFHLDQHRRAVENHGPLNVADGRLLWLFSDRTPRTLRQIADELNLEQSTVNRQVNGAHQAGLLDRQRDPDRGAYVFQASEAGLARFEEAVASSLGQYDDALAALGPGEAAQLVELLGKFVTAYGEVVEGSAPRR